MLDPFRNAPTFVGPNKLPGSREGVVFDVENQQVVRITLIRGTGMSTSVV